jgi:hypothetical protein
MHRVGAEARFIQEAHSPQAAFVEPAIEGKVSSVDFSINQAVAYLVLLVSLRLKS